MITEHKFWFNTGVQPHNRPGVPLREHEAWRGGVLQIAYYLEYAPPEGYHPKYLCDYLEALQPGEIAIPVVGGGMLSKFAMFSRY